jgi:hypothetical protein
MERHVAIKALEKADPIANQHGQDREAHLVREAQAQAFPGDGPASGDPDLSAVT